MILELDQAEKCLEEMNKGVVSIKSKAYLPIDTLVQEATEGRELRQENCILKSRLLALQKEQMQWENGCDIEKGEWEKERTMLLSEISAAVKRELALKEINDNLQKDKQQCQNELKERQKEIKTLTKQTEKNRKLTLGELVFIFYLVIGYFTVLMMSYSEFSYAVNIVLVFKLFVEMIGRCGCIIFPGIVVYLLIWLIRKIFIKDSEVDGGVRVVAIACFIIVTILSVNYFGGMSFEGDWSNYLYEQFFGFPNDVSREEFIQNAIYELQERGWDI